MTLLPFGVATVTTLILFSIDAAKEIPQHLTLLAFLTRVWMIPHLVVVVHAKPGKLKRGLD